MKTTFPGGRRAAFTLVEMIGVLAVISILSSMLAPRVFQAISDARIANAVGTCNSVKSSVNEYYGRYGKIGGTNGTTLSLPNAGDKYEDWDRRCLVAEGYMEKPFLVKVGNERMGSGNGGSRMRVINISGLNANSPAAADLTSIDSGAYNRDGANATNDVMGSLVVEACIEDVDMAEARELSNRLDGSTLSTASGNDESGRVKYFVTTNGVAKVRIYIAHR